MPGAGETFQGKAAISIRPSEPGQQVTMSAYDVRFLSVNGEQKPSKTGNERSTLSRVSLHLVVRFGRAWRAELPS
jgi:hypothetical protein